jgi:hypothetical protein
LIHLHGGMPSLSQLVTVPSRLGYTIIDMRIRNLRRQLERMAVNPTHLSVGAAVRARNVEWRLIELVHPCCA